MTPPVRASTVEAMAMLPREYRVMFEIEEEYWWYRGLRGLLVELLARYGAKDARMLDAGCGTGANLRLLLEHGDAIGVDIAEEAIQFCRARGIAPQRAFVASLLELPFPDNYFGLAFSFDVICNIVDDVRALAELGRVVRPGGRAIVQLPAYHFLWSAHDVAVGHKHRYTARSLRQKVARAGWAVERMTYLNSIFFPLEVMARLWRRGAVVNGNAHSDLAPLPRSLNELLARVFTAEMRAAARVKFPYGLSLMVVARKV
jgi:SAM-dependent methyltransferase